jgi:antitoxin component of RelBE/YafQ-DinJ toxin-antitoxin module
MSRQDVDDYLARSVQPLTGALGDLCELIRGVDARIDEEIKWNGPSFSIADHFATTGFSPAGSLRLVLHTGAAKREVPLELDIDAGGLPLDWKGTDRAVLTFTSEEDVHRRADALRSVLRQWIEQTQG